MSLAVNGKCPICGIGPVSNLDHYLAKSLYPTYAITPINLVPECRDCNFNKRDTLIKSATDSPLHPYYDEIDNRIWLVAELVKDKFNWTLIFWLVTSYIVSSMVYLTWEFKWPILIFEVVAVLVILAIVFINKNKKRANN